MEVMGEDRRFTLDIPQREGKEGYLGTFFSLYLRMASVLSEQGFSPTDGRAKYLTYLIISLIPNENKQHPKDETYKRREILRQRLKDRIKELTDEYIKYNNNTPGNTEAGQIELTACLEVIGEVSDFMDKYLGVSTRNKIGFVQRKSGELVLESEK